jgi:hypothetical protein
MADIARMSDECGISEELIRSAICEKTPEEKKLCNMILLAESDKELDEIAQSVDERSPVMLDVLARKLTFAKTVEEIDAVRERIKKIDDSGTLYDQALDALSLASVVNANTFDLAREAYGRCLITGKYVPQAEQVFSRMIIEKLSESASVSMAREVADVLPNCLPMHACAKEEWRRRSVRAILKAESFSDLEFLAKDFPEDKDILSLYYSRMAELASTMHEAWRAYELVQNEDDGKLRLCCLSAWLGFVTCSNDVAEQCNYEWSYESFSTAEKIIINRRRDELSQGELDAAESFEDFLEVVDDARNGSNVQKKAIKQLLSCIHDFDQGVDAYNLAGELFDEDLRSKVQNVCLKLVDSPEKGRELYDLFYGCIEFQKLIIRKIAEFY